MRTIPVHLISGFLGSGKTSAILNILKIKPDHEKWFVLINEFGKVSIDSLSFQEENSDDQLLELSGGCICCSSSEYFRENLTTLLSETNPDRILIEPTGLGGIEMIKNILSSFSELVISPVICLVDILSLNNDRIKSNFIYQSQLKEADILVLSKCDTESSTEKINNTIKQLKNKYPDKLHYTKSDSNTFSISILDIPFSSKKKPLGENVFSVHTDQLAGDRYDQKTITTNSEQLFDIQKLKNLISDLGIFLRVKGFLNTPLGWVNFNLSMEQITVTNCKPKAENQLVFIFPMRSMDLNVLSIKIRNQCLLPEIS